MFSKVKTLTIFLGVIAAISCLVLLISNLLEYNICENTVIETVDAPDGLKKVIIFSTDCGATTGFGIHASVLNNNQNIDNESEGNALRLNSNQGKAWPKDSQGRPIIRAKWDSATSVTLEYSSNSDVFYQKSEVENVQVNSISVIK